MENPLNDALKFEHINLKYDGMLSFDVNQKKNKKNWVDKTFKKLVVCNSMSEEIRVLLNQTD